jgi:hypothetical protein
MLNRKYDQWRFLSLLQADFVSAMDVHVVMCCAWKVILVHTGVDGTTLCLCKEGI